MTRIGFIGMGKMGTALAAQTHADIAFTDIRPGVTLTVGGKSLTSVPLDTLLAQSDVIVLAIKPKQIQGVLKAVSQRDISGVNLWISILAGTPLSTFQAALGNQVPVVRAMPNTPTMVKKGMTAVSFSPAVSGAWQTWTADFFGAVGSVVTVAENQLNAITALSGSGPAFFYKIADAMAKEGQQLGLSYPSALALVTQTMAGAAEMLRHFGDPNQLADNVTSPGGTTAAGLAEYDRLHIHEAVQSVIKATFDRAITLEKEH